MPQKCFGQMVIPLSPIVERLSQMTGVTVGVRPMFSEAPQLRLKAKRLS